MARLGSLEEAVRALHEGDLACFPTETLWSLSCDAEHPDAVQRLRDAKGRPESVPLAVGFATWQAACLYTRPSAQAHFLAETWLPGPLSLIVPATDDSLGHVAPGARGLAIRVPDHPIAQAVLGACGPIVMTSANRHRGPDPRSADEVLAALEDVERLVIVDADPVPGTPSTIIDCTQDPPRVVREGSLRAAELGIPLGP